MEHNDDQYISDVIAEEHNLDVNQLKLPHPSEVLRCSTSDDPCFDKLKHFVKTSVLDEVSNAAATSRMLYDELCPLHMRPHWTITIMLHLFAIDERSIYDIFGRAGLINPSDPRHHKTEIASRMVFVSGAPGVRAKSALKDFVVKAVAMFYISLVHKMISKL